MKRNSLLIILLLGVLAIIFFILIFTSNKQCSNCQKIGNQQISQVCLKDTCFNVELATTTEEMARGLMSREKLEENKGMLFIYEKEQIRGFWMKDTLIPLDIIWLNKNQEVVFIKKNAEPCGNLICIPTISPQKAQYVLEINAGLADKINLNIGEQLIFK